MSSTTRTHNGHLFQCYHYAGQWWFSLWNSKEWYTPQDVDGYDSLTDCDDAAMAYCASV
jgi:hypothetical protein